MFSSSERKSIIRTLRSDVTLLLEMIMHIKRAQKINPIMQMLRVTRPTDTSCQRELLFVEYKQYKPPLESSPLMQVKHLDAKLHEATTWPSLCLRSVGTLVKVQTNGINTTEANRRAPERPRRNERPHVHK